MHGSNDEMLTEAEEELLQAQKRQALVHFYVERRSGGNGQVELHCEMNVVGVNMIELEIEDGLGIEWWAPNIQVLAVTVVKHTD